jgi:hypothetical protein
MTLGTVITAMDGNGIANLDHQSFAVSFPTGASTMTIQTNLAAFKPSDTVVTFNAGSTGTAALSDAPIITFPGYVQTTGNTLGFIALPGGVLTVNRSVTATNPLNVYLSVSGISL